MEDLGHTKKKKIFAQLGQRLSNHYTSYFKKRNFFQTGEHLTLFGIIRGRLFFLANGRHVLLDESTCGSSTTGSAGPITSRSGVPTLFQPESYL